MTVLDPEGVDALVVKLATAVARIERDARYQLPPASVRVDAALALTQTELHAKRTSYRWMLEQIRILAVTNEGDDAAPAPSGAAAVVHHAANELVIDGDRDARRVLKGSM